MPKRTAIVTGGAGFIGSHVLDALLADGWAAVVLDDLSTGDARQVPDEASLELVDITDRALVDRTVDAARPSAIFHLAAQASVTRSVADPTQDALVNVLGTLNVLEAATRHGAQVIFTSTGGALYGDAAPIPTTEEFIPAPKSPYGASKWAAESYLVTWREAHGIPNAVCRLGNVYGPRQNPHGEAGVVAIFSHRLWGGQAPTLFGFGKPTRDYVHVHDVARALLASVGTPGTFNVATGVETDVAELYRLMQGAAGTALDPELAPLRPGELERSCLDPSRAARELGWRAEVDLGDGLAQTYRALVARFEADALSPDAR
ncbi:MAG TPA: NAD-dependent epimerase/dehydratase family protein [Solirubrobacteraceae bacterium]|jgi:UDP-glucose 4-epimerase|nr:NAD-dependent epimerase/dehydratase family protein [Solirubrobacteraceae bacterium]